MKATFTTRWHESIQHYLQRPTDRVGYDLLGEPVHGGGHAIDGEADGHQGPAPLLDVIRGQRVVFLGQRHHHVTLAGRAARDLNVELRVLAGRLCAEKRASKLKYL